METQIIERLNRAIATKGLSISRISEQLEIDRSVLNKFVNGQRIPNIEVIMKILEFLFTSNIDRYTILRSLVPSFKSIYPLKVILEIARLNRDEETVTKAAKIIKTASKQKDKEWADFYLLWQEFRSGKLDKTQYLEALLAFPLQSDELKTFRKLTLSHYHFTIVNQNETALEYCLNAKEDIDALPSSLLKNSYLARYYGYQGQLLMRTNEMENTITLLEKSNSYCISDLMRGINIYNLAVSYQFKDHQKTCQYILDTDTIFREFSIYDPSLTALGDYIVQETLPLCKINANDLEDIKEEQLLYPQSKIMYNIRTGNTEKAKNLLNSLSKDEKEDEFYLLCEGIIEESIPILLKSLSKSIEKYEFNEAQLTIRELHKLGCDQLIIDSMINARLGKHMTYFNT